jgi:hypothetical protein
MGKMIAPDYQNIGRLYEKCTSVIKWGASVSLIIARLIPAGFHRFRSSNANLVQVRKAA